MGMVVVVQVVVVQVVVGATGGCRPRLRGPAGTPPLLPSFPGLPLNAAPTSSSRPAGASDWRLLPRGRGLREVQRGRGQK